MSSTTSARLTLENFDAEGFDDLIDAQLTGHSQISYDPEAGYQLLNVYTTTEEDQRWVGERASGDERYNFYYVGSSASGTLGNARRDTRVELRFVGQDVFLVDTWVQTDKGEVQVQSYRFTRSS